ncbi:TAXI family TRAP transporter solute-binding subunit [Methylobacterium nigriterrae]|uniref:TAXI family TRAP transporter solute-binding subunit n=1 Tax=Methylobacterium nigriterrae TaxID=3127512 RepID=UPI003013EB6F
MPSFLLRREFLFLAAAIVLAAVSALAIYVSQATTLTVAVAPKGGTEPPLIRAYAQALESGRENIRLRILPFDDVRESAAALQDGRADLAVVRPDVAMPRNGLTLAILRDQAMIIASPEPAGIRHFPDLARKRLGIAAHREADREVLRSLLDYYGLTLLTEMPTGPLPKDSVLLVPVEANALEAAFTARHIDAVVSIIAPATPAALAIVNAVSAASRNRKVSFVAVEDAEAIIERLPKLQAVTMPAGIFGGNPKLPDDEVKTVGASYRLMATPSLGRIAAADVTQHLFELRSQYAETTPAGDYMLAPSYETTAAATSARLPIHPGAIDYYEREQRSFLDRYQDWIYILASIGGGLGSGFAWLSQRVARTRRERTDVVLDRLLEILEETHAARAPPDLDALTREIDTLAADVVRHTRERETDTRTFGSLTLAIDGARSAVAAARRRVEAGGAAASRPRAAE